MNILSSITNYIWNDGTKDTLTLATHANVKKYIYNFRCPKDYTTAQLIVSKTETDKQVYSVFIKFLGIENERRKWEISIYKDDQVEIPWYRFQRYTGSRAISFKIVDENYVKVKEYDERTQCVGYIDLHSKGYALRNTLPPPAIQNLIRVARAFPTDSYKEIRFNESIVVMTINDFAEDDGYNTYKVHVGDNESSDLIESPSQHCNGAICGMMGIAVEFKGQKHLLELMPMVGTANVSSEDIKWDHKRLYSA